MPPGTGSCVVVSDDDEGALLGIDNICIVTLGSHMSFSNAASSGLCPFASGFTDSMSLARIVHSALSAAINCDRVTRLKFAGGSDA